MRSSSASGPRPPSATRADRAGHRLWARGATAEILTGVAFTALATAEVHELHDYGAEEMALGMRYAEAELVDAAGRPVADLARLSAMEAKAPRVDVPGSRIGGDGG